MKEVEKIRWVWDSVPKQLSKENNKFVFSHVKEGKRSTELENALQWIVDAGPAQKLELAENPGLPLSSAADASWFKVYLSDVGLLRKRSGLSYQTILENHELYTRFKGAFAENYVLCQMKCLGIPVYFWRTKADAEVDFISDYEGSIFPIEVKSADNTKAKSLHLFCSRFQSKFAFKTSLKNVGVYDVGCTHVWNVPLYVIFRLRSYINRELS